VEAREAILRGARARIGKRRTELERIKEEKHGPMGERLSADIVTQVELVPLTSIKPDPDFENLRLPATPEELDQLATSMQTEGLKTPITLVPSVLRRGVFHVRAGFRRTEAARRLKWKTIPSIILSADIPAVTEHWINVIENSARDRLSTYELARAAQSMRDKFGVKPREFATKSGISEAYAFQLLRAIDRLPPEIVEEWKGKAPIPWSVLYQWSGLRHEEAIRQSQIYANRFPKVVGDWHPPGRKANHKIKMASALGLRRMQRLRFQVEVSRALTEKERKLAIDIVDFCTGARELVIGVNDTPAKQNMREYRSRRREDLTSLDDPHEPELAALEATLKAASTTSE
jgi:ParB/RepB/Spo0J family partition protein